MLRRAIRDEPGIFAFAVAGSCLFSLMTVASAYVVGAIVGHVIVPAFNEGRVGTGALGGAAAAVLGVATFKVIGIFGRRLGAGSMQYRLQARYRRRVTARYLDLPISWHQKHATGTLLSNANADVEAAFYPIAPLPFAVGTVVMLIASVVSLFVLDWALALVSLAIFPGLFLANFWYARSMSPRISHAQQLRAKLSAAAHESFDGALVVKTMGRESHETERFAARATELRDAMIRVGPGPRHVRPAAGRPAEPRHAGGAGGRRRPAGCRRRQRRRRRSASRSCSACCRCRCGRSVSSSVSCPGPRSAGAASTTS